MTTTDSPPFQVPPDPPRGTTQRTSIHMLCGPTGSGKTTFGRSLARERRAALFVIDEWMGTLFMPDAPRPITLDWAIPRVARCETQIWATVLHLASIGVESVVELGFFTRDQRDRFRATAAEAELKVRTYSLGAPRAVRLERVRRRNLGSETLTIQVDDGTFEWAEGYYEALGADELRDAVILGPEVELR